MMSKKELRTYTFKVFVLGILAGTIITNLIYLSKFI